MKTANEFDKSPSWDTPSNQKVKWCLETERDDLRFKLDWYTKSLQEPSLSMGQFLQLARERNQLTVKLDRVKKQIGVSKAKNYSIKRLMDAVVETVTVPQGVRLGR